MQDSADNINNCNQLNTYTSSTNIVKKGVPQGSILGSLLFLIYITGCSTIIKEPSNICLFSYDIRLKIQGISEPEVEISAFANLSKTMQYLLKLYLLPNPIKTKYIAFSDSKLNSVFNYTILNILCA